MLMKFLKQHFQNYNDSTCPQIQGQIKNFLNGKLGTFSRSLIRTEDAQGYEIQFNQSFQANVDAIKPVKKLHFILIKKQMYKRTSTLVVVVCILATLTNENISPLPPLPDWNDIYDALLAKDLPKVEEFVDNVIRGPWHCRQKFSFLQCLYGRINAFHLALVTDFPFELIEVPTNITSKQKLHREINNLINIQRLKLNSTGELLNDLNEFEAELESSLTEQEVQNVASDILLSTQRLVDFGFSDREFQSPKFTRDDFLVPRKNKTKLDNDVQDIESQITDIQRKNNQIDGMVGDLIQQKNDNNKEIQNLRKKIRDLNSQIADQREVLGDVKDAEDEINGIEFRNNEIDRLVDRLLQEENQNDRRINELEKRMRDLNKQLQQQQKLRVDLKVAEDQLGDVQRRNNEVDRIIDRIQQQKKDNSINIDGLRLKLINLNGRLAQQRELEGDIRTTQDQISNFQDRNKQLDELIQQFIQQKNNNTLNIDDLRRNIISLKGKLSDLEKIEEDIIDVQGQLSGLLGRNNQIDQEFQQLFQQKTSNNKEIDDLRDKINALNRELIETTKELEEQIRKAEAELAFIVEKNSQLEKNLEKLFQQKNQNNDVINELRKRIRGLSFELLDEQDRIKENIIKFEIELAAIARRNTELDKNFQNLFSEKNKNNQAMDDLRLRMKDLNSNLQQQKSRLNSDIRDSENQISGILGLNNDLDRNIEKLLLQKSQNNKKINDFRRQIITLNSKLSDQRKLLDKDIKNIQDQIADLEGKNNEIDGTVARLLSQRGDNNKKVNDLKRRINDLRNQIQRQENRIKSSLGITQNELFDLQNRNDDIGTRVEQLLEEKNKNNENINEAKKKIQDLNGEIKEQQGKLLKDIQQFQLQIDDFERRNEQISRLIDDLLNSKDGNALSVNNLQTSIDDLRQAFDQQEDGFKLSPQKIKQLIQKQRNDINNVNEDLMDIINQQRVIQISIFKSIGPLNGFQDIFVKIQRAQFGCYIEKAQAVEYRNQSVFSQIQRRKLDRYLHTSLGPGAFQTVELYLSDDEFVQVELLNIFQRQWIDENGNPLNESVADPQCCSVQSFNFRTGDIVSIKGNEIEVIFRTGQRMTLTINVCSRIYVVTEKISKILFISQPYGILNKILGALLYG